MIYQKKLEIRYETDIIIVGGGAAGVAAAVAAARQGKKVLVVESGGCFGGLGTSGLVPNYCTYTDGERVLAAGIGLELRRMVSDTDPIKDQWPVIDAEDLKRAYDTIMQESGVDFLFFTTMCDVVTSDAATGRKQIEYVVLSSSTGMYAAKAKVYIDCTGEGNLVALAGGRFQIGDEQGRVMPPSLCSIWTGVDLDTYHHRKKSIKASLEEAFRDGVFTFEDRHLVGLCPRDGDICGGNIGHIFDTDPLDDRSVTHAMVWGRKSMMEFLRFYRDYVDGCENIRLVATAERLGIRESRRITCDYTLSVQDFFGRADFEDEIGRYCYPIDIHIKNTSEEEYQRFLKEFSSLFRLKRGESYGIPYRSLIPVSFDNVLTAGRCMGTDHYMEASIRVMPGCYITGEAAGYAAAMAVESGNVRHISVPALQRTLLEKGAYLRESLAASL